jgi:hypothetical protein
LAQFNEPSFHSCSRPAIKIMVNSVALVNKIVKLVTLIRIGIGISRTISISNTIKIIARRKKRIENGIRAL